MKVITFALMQMALELLLNAQTTEVNRTGKGVAISIDARFKQQVDAAEKELTARTKDMEKYKLEAKNFPNDPLVQIAFHAASVNYWTAKGKLHGTQALRSENMGAAALGIAEGFRRADVDPEIKDSIKEIDRQISRATADADHFREAMKLDPSLKLRLEHAEQALQELGKSHAIYEEMLKDQDGALADSQAKIQKMKDIGAALFDEARSYWVQAATAQVHAAFSLSKLRHARDDRDFAVISGEFEKFLAPKAQTSPITISKGNDQ